MFEQHRLKWFLALCALLLLRWFVPVAWLERYYARGFFPALRYAYDYTLGWLPFPMLYVALPLALWGAWRYGRRVWANALGWRQKLGHGTLALLNALGFVGSFFLVAWGFNYGRPGLSEQLALQPAEANADSLWQHLAELTPLVLEARTAVSRDTQALGAAHLPPALEEQCRNDLAIVLRSHAFPTPGKPRCRRLWPDGSLLHISTAGVYLPFVFEGHVDAGLHPLQLPFTMSHELAHAYGFSDEGDCNLWGFLACRQSAQPFVRYSGYLALWRYAAVSCRLNDEARYLAFRAQLPRGLLADLDAINQRMRAYPDIMPRLRDVFYDSYLKSQGIQDGLLSYDKVLVLAAAWRWRYNEGRW